MKKQWFNPLSPVRSLDEAEKMIRELAYGFYTLAALQAGIAIFLNPLTLIDAAALAVSTVFFHKFRSRIAAFILLLLSILILFNTFSNKIDGRTGGSNIVLALIVCGFGVRAVESSIKYNKYKNAVA